MSDETVGCGCLILSVGLGLAFLILCAGAAWWMISSAWSWSFGG